MAITFSCHQTRCLRFLIAIVAAVGSVVLSESWAIAVGETVSESNIDFRSQILPILESHCFQCHAEDSAEGELRLDSLLSVRAGGHTGAEIIAATAVDSELFRRITSADPSYRMPKKSAPLSASEIETIRQWIDEGAEWPEAVVQRESENLDQADVQSANIERDTVSKQENGFQWQDWIAESRFDFLLWWLILGLILLGLVALVLFDQRRSRLNARESWTACFRVRYLWLMLIGWLLLGAGLFQLGMIRELQQENQDLLQRLNQQMAVRARNEKRFQVELDASRFDEPLHPMHPKRLGGVYYRGNDERSPELFNGGFYRTATMETWLVDDTGNRLKWGDDIRDRSVAISFSIERAPGTTAALFTNEIMDGVFLKHHRFKSLKPPVVESDPAEYRIKILNIESTTSMPKWTAQVPLTQLGEWNDGIAEGVIYIHQGNRLDGEMKGRVHFGIRFRIQIEGGKISAESELWMGSMYHLAGRAIVPAEGTILVDHWFDFRPMPEIDGSNSSDPKLLGIPEHQSGADAEGDY